MLNHVFDIRRCFVNVEIEQALPSGEKKSQDRGPKSKSIIKTIILLSFIALKKVACEQALLFGQAKRASRERASEGPRDSFQSPK